MSSTTLAENGAVISVTIRQAVQIREKTETYLLPRIMIIHAGMVRLTNVRVSPAAVSASPWLIVKHSVMKECDTYMGLTSGESHGSHRKTAIPTVLSAVV